MLMTLHPLKRSTTFDYEEVCKESHLLDKLSSDQIKELKNVIIKDREVFSSDPGTTHLMKMDIELISEKPIKTKPCRMSPRQINLLKDEIKRILDLGVIEIGQSDFTSPLILCRLLPPKWSNTHRVFPFAEHCGKG
ncbi:retrovirus-related Pol polyprotein from transposon 17.6 [Trichonephila inaurata madagascariensis]|uniref:Retrovirus-related Pol polyprotein from transposon 17.6 n=1 Tax=Trichonephila inaurata madagascariensis TaxID=2747483 RepID=A0A8X6I4I1_9ARAC|nr:retrovirus-related Pol polyprotein from transposon 17.6 [Trichonephila inaurata madagascariensis]